MKPWLPSTQAVERQLEIHLDLGSSEEVLRTVRTVLEACRERDAEEAEGAKE